MLNRVLLRTFVEIVDNSSFAVAANRLSLTPSAVSGHLRKLEEVTGKILIERTTRRVQLTEEGEMLYTYARNMIRLEQEVLARLDGTPVEARLRIGTSEDFASAWLPQILRNVWQAHPEVSMELKVGITSKLMADLGRGQLDLVIGKRLHDSEGGEFLWKEDLVWAGRDDFVIRRDRPLPLLVFPEPCALREAARLALASGGRDWKPIFESTSYAGCVGAALAGLGITPIECRQLREGLRIFDQADGLPVLGSMHYVAFYNHRDPIKNAVISLVKEAGLKSSATNADDSVAV